MKKKSASKVFRDFEVDVLGGLAYLTASMSSLTLLSHQSRAATMVFQQTYVAFERYLSDLIVTYVNRAPATFSTDAQSRIRQSMESKHGRWLASRTSVALPEHMTVAEVEAALDPEGHSVTFTSVEKLKQFAARTLSPAYSAKFQALSADDSDLIDAARLIRHHISHRSDASRVAMNTALAALKLTGPNFGLRRAGNEVQTVGAYLRSQHGGATRTHSIALRLTAIGKLLSV